MKTSKFGAIMIRTIHATSKFSSSNVIQKRENAKVKLRLKNFWKISISSTSTMKYSISIRMTIHQEITSISYQNIIGLRFKLRLAIHKQNTSRSLISSTVWKGLASVSIELKKEFFKAFQDLFSFLLITIKRLPKCYLLLTRQDMRW